MKKILRRAGDEDHFTNQIGPYNFFAHILIAFEHSFGIQGA